MFSHHFIIQKHDDNTDDLLYMENHGFFLHLYLSNTVPSGMAGSVQKGGYSNERRISAETERADDAVEYLQRPAGRRIERQSLTQQPMVWNKGAARGRLWNIPSRSTGVFFNFSSRTWVSMLTVVG